MQAVSNISNVVNFTPPKLKRGRHVRKAGMLIALRRLNDTVATFDQQTATLTIGDEVLDIEEAYQLHEMLADLFD